MGVEAVGQPRRIVRGGIPHMPPRLPHRLADGAARLGPQLVVQDTSELARQGVVHAPQRRDHGADAAVSDQRAGPAAQPGNDSPPVPISLTFLEFNRV